MSTTVGGSSGPRSTVTRVLGLMYAKRDDKRRAAYHVAAGLMLACVAATPTAGAPAPRAGAGLQITADEITVDAARRVATAVGQVRISDGRVTATSARATVHHAQGRGVLTGNARVVAPQGDLEGWEITVEFTAQTITRVTARGNASLDAEDTLTAAQTIVIVPADATLVAEGEVSVFAKPDIIATAPRLRYARGEGRIVLDGRARVRNRDGFVEADRLEGLRLSERVVATGGVHASFRDIEVRSRTAEVFAVERRAVFAGDVRLTQPGRRMVTERVTIWYDEGRVVAEGQTSIRLEPQR